MEELRVLEKGLGCREWEVVGGGILRLSRSLYVDMCVHSEERARLIGYLKKANIIQQQVR